jgi:hypothetical protein
MSRPFNPTLLHQSSIIHIYETSRSAKHNYRRFGKVTARRHIPEGIHSLTQPYLYPSQFCSPSGHFIHRIFKYSTQLVAVKHPKLFFYPFYIRNISRRDEAKGQKTRCSNSESDMRQFCSPKGPDQFSGVNPNTSSMGNAGSFMGVKRPGRVFDH